MKFKIVAACAAVSTLLGAPAVQAADWDVNWHVAGSTGLLWRLADVDIDLSGTRTELDLADFGGNFGLSLGIDWHMKYWVFGLDVGVNWESIDKNEQFAITRGANGYNGIFNYERGTAYSASARFGYHFADFLMPYVRLGVQSSLDSFRFETFGPVTAGVLEPHLEDKTVTKLFYGAGIETPFFGQSTVRLEYNFMEGNAIRVHDTTAPDTGVIEVNNVRNHVLKAVWTWNFG